MFVWSKSSSIKDSEFWNEQLAGHPSLVVTCAPSRRTVQFDVYCGTRGEAEALRREHGGSVRRLASRNWAAVHPVLPPPVKIRDRLLVCAESERDALMRLAKAHPARTILSIPPDMAFGTGHHETTSTVLRLLVDFSDSRRGRDWSMADLGTGSGLLAIAAVELGAVHAWGCDFDPHAVRVARVNVRRNRTPRVVIDEADVLRWSPPERFDCIAANLFSEVLMEAFPRMVQALKADGVLLISGILRSQAAGCLQAARRAGLKIDLMVARGKWVTAWAVPCKATGSQAGL